MYLYYHNIQYKSRKKENIPENPGIFMAIRACYDFAIAL